MEKEQIILEDTDSERGIQFISFVYKGLKLKISLFFIPKVINKQNGYNMRYRDSSALTAWVTFMICTIISFGLNMNINLLPHFSSACPSLIALTVFGGCGSCLKSLQSINEGEKMGICKSVHDWVNWPVQEQKIQANNSNLAYRYVEVRWFGILPRTYIWNSHQESPVRPAEDFKLSHYNSGVCNI